jgi:aldehyde:ferredoxin oxidoreductase
LNGWMGRVLRVNLGDGKAREEAFDPAAWKACVGGRGFGARVLCRELAPGIDPLGRENLLVFAVGPLTGTKAPASGRFSASFKSPLTGTIADANSGGRWGTVLKRCGWDAVVVEGRAARPSVLRVTEEGATLEDAGGLWGLDTWETTDRLLAGGGEGEAALCIGPAGENRARIAAIVNEKSHALGRGGGGAVMGSKNLKAVTVRGSRRTGVADPERMDFVTYEAAKLVKAHPLTSKALPELGTAAVVRVMNDAGIWPTRNFQESRFEGADRICGEAVSKTLLRKRAGCLGCTIRCKRETRTSHAEGEGPEFETAWAMGAALGISDLETVAEAGYLCNRMGLDIISTGGTLACAMELAQRGIADAGIGFGQADRLLGAIEAIARRSGAGDALAEGARRYAEANGAGEYAMHVKGMELPGYDPRGVQGQGLGYATSNRGGCHLRGGFLVAPEVLGVPRMIRREVAAGKGGYAVLLQNAGAAIDSLIVCRFATFAMSETVLARLLSAVTGVEYTPEDLMRAGERTYNLERLFNVREGFRARDDNLPRRLLEEPVKEGPAKGQVSRLPDVLQEYYRFRGWDDEGVPRKEKLAELGIDF